MPDDSIHFRLGALKAGGWNSPALLEGKLASLGAADKANKTGKIGASPQVNGQPDEIEKAATQFEALLLHEMLKEMWNTVPKSGLLSGSHEESMYRDMLNQGIANEIAEKQSIGVKEVIVREMREREKK